jgi:hypothetical protein
MRYETGAWNRFLVPFKADKFKMGFVSAISTKREATINLLTNLLW